MAESYITNAQLRILVQDSRDAGRVSEELGVILRRMAEGIHARYQRDLDQEEFISEAVLHTLTKLHKADLTNNVFSWISTVMINHGRQLFRKQTTVQKTLAKFTALQIPDRRQGRPKARYSQSD